MMEEVFDVCDEQDRVIGQAARSEVHAKNLLHRAVHIWVWNSAGELLLQLRTPTKDQYPCCFTSSASGHVDTGEEYEASAKRELWEELRLQGDLVWGEKIPASAETAFEHTVLYHLQSDSPPTPDPTEISEIQYLSTAGIAEKLRFNPEKFTPPFKKLFESWWRQEVACAGIEPILPLSSDLQ